MRSKSLVAALAAEMFMERGKADHLDFNCEPYRVEPYPPKPKNKRRQNLKRHSHNDADLKRIALAAEKRAAKGRKRQAAYDAGLVNNPIG